MVEQQLEGDKVADLGLGNLVAAPVLENKLVFQLLLPFSLGFLLQWRLSWILVLPLTGGWKRVLSSPSLMCNVQNDPRS